MKAMKKPAKIVLSVIAFILAFIICWGGLMYWYYPHYKNKKKEIVLNEIINENELRVMSYNLRCLNPTDLGKKSWFYRADLIIDSIEKEQPGV